jgi:uncharacterized protein YecT (DUF1311 family)
MSALASALALLALGASTAPAAHDAAQSSMAPPTNPFDREYDRCQREAPIELETTGVLYRQCGAALLKRAATRMRRELSSALGSLNTSKAKRALAAEQRAFEAAMEGRCSMYTSGDFGQMGRDLDWFVCEARLIKARVEYLRVFAQGRGGETRYD